MKVLFVTSECVPFAKTGGLADVSGAFPQELKGHSIRVMMPLYGSIDEGWRKKMKFLKYVYIRLAWRNLYCGLFELKHNGVMYYFLDNEYYFRRAELYGSYDDGERFAFFSRAVAAMIAELGDWAPDIVHCNDWQTALVPAYIRKLYAGDPLYDNIKTVFTIHNIEYQGRFGSDMLSNVIGLPMDLYYDGTMEFMSGISLMKGALHFADAVTTVSPTYAEELRYSFYAHGLEGVIQANAGKLTGILNGLDYGLFDPETDTNLAKNFSVDTLPMKQINKTELQKLLGLSVDASVPIIAMVGRLVAHKGLDLLEAVFSELMEMEIQLVILGRGDWHFEQLVSFKQQGYPGRMSASMLYNDSLARKIYAGSDIFLMPSRSEPCGLAQMIAMRYGTVPLVRETGGLRDTVKPYNAETGDGTGFCFANYNANDMLYVIREAIKVYQSDAKAWQKLQKNAMTERFSWADSGKKYAELYKSLQ